MARTEKPILMHNRDEWRAWLEKHHATEKEVWLIHYKKHTGKQALYSDEAIEEALCFGWIDGLLRRIDDEKHMLRYSPRRKNSIWAESNKKRARKMIRAGRMTEAGLAKIREAKANGQWDKAREREDPKTVPADLVQALSRNAKARAFFETLAPSYRKQYIYWITSAKKPETRASRIDKTVQRLDEGRKPGIG